MSLFDVTRKSIWHSFFMQLIGAVVATVIVFAARSFGDGDNKILLVTLFWCEIAILLAVFMLRGVSTYPGAESSAYIVPSFSLSFGIVLIVFLAGRFPYSLFLLMGSFLASVVWTYIVYFKIQRARDLSVGVIGKVNPELIASLNQVVWKYLPDPSASVEGLVAIAVDLRTDLPSEWERRLADYALSGLPVYHIKHLYESLTGRVELEQLSESSFGSLSPLSAYMSVKHLFDWLLAFIAGVILMPLFAMVALLIRIDSPGPALFRQSRIGYRGQPFTVLKFRTMHVEAVIDDNARTAAMTQDNDARITRLGAWLRKTRIDELPQIVNILRGEMSWIGPRPEAQVLSKWYEEEIPFYPYRHIVRPGITGWAQVNQGHVAEIADVKSKLHYDFYYVKHYSPWIDLLIVARTFRTMITGYGAR